MFFFCRLDTFAYRIGYRAGFAKTSTDVTVAVSHDNEGTPAHGTPTFGGFLALIGTNYALFKVERIGIYLRQCKLLLELQAAFACAVCQRLYATMIVVATAVKDNRSDSFCGGAFGK